MPSSAAQGLRVLELSSTEGPARVCADLLANLGADVLRPTSTPETLLDSVEGWAVRSSDSGSVGLADIVLIDHHIPGGYECDDVVEEGLALADQGVVVCVFSPFGLDGPLSDLWGTEIIVQAMSGMMMANGEEADPPVMSGVPVARLTAALQGVAAVLAAILRRDRIEGGLEGEFIDLSAYDVLVAMMGTLLPPFFLRNELPPRIGNRHMMGAPWNVYPSKDGWTVLTTMGEPIWLRFVEMIEMPELLSDERFSDTELRVSNVKELDEVVASWTKQHDTAEILRLAAANEVPASEISPLDAALAEATQRQSIAVNKTEHGYEAGVPMLLVPNDTPSATCFPVAKKLPAGRDEHDTPLGSILLVEVGALTAGPAAGRLLALLGADVLKVEPPTGELSRHLAQRVSGDGYLYYLNNAGKRGTVLDLRRSEDADELKAIVDDADVFLSNLSVESLGRSGMSWRNLSGRNPELVYCGVSGFGAFGERANDKAFDTIIQALSGIMALTGPSEGAPLKIAASVVDYVSACAAAAGTVAALRARTFAGAGFMVDISMLDVAIWITQDAWSDVHDGRTRRMGNGSRTHAPHGVFETKDGALVIDVVDDQGWEQLASALDIVDANAAHATWRVGHAEEVASAVQKWASERQRDDVVTWCRERGVLCAPVFTLDQVASSEHTRARHLLIEQVTYAGDRIRVIGSPFKFRRARVEVTSVAPALPSQLATSDAS